MEWLWIAVPVVLLALAALLDRRARRRGIGSGVLQAWIRPWVIASTAISSPMSSR
jgi:hypothetical protein